MNFPEYRTLAERAKSDDRLPDDEFDSKQIESPMWVQKYLDLADRAIQRSKEEDKNMEERAVFRKWQG